MAGPRIAREHREFGFPTASMLLLGPWSETSFLHERRILNVDKTATQITHISLTHSHSLEVKCAPFQAKQTDANFFDLLEPFPDLETKEFTFLFSVFFCDSEKYFEILGFCFNPISTSPAMSAANYSIKQVCDETGGLALRPATFPSQACVASFSARSISVVVFFFPVLIC